MISEYDKSQDRRIASNTKAIASIADCIREIRDHFEPIHALIEYVPQKWAKIVWKMRFFAKLGVVAVVVFNVGAWYLGKRQLHNMSERYAEVARRLYYTENNPDVALPFIDKALEIEPELPEYIFFRAYVKGMAATRDLLNLGRPFTKEELDRAHQAYAEAVFLQGLNPKRPEPYILQGQVLAALKETTRAKEAIQKAVEIDPQSDFALIRLAMVQLDEKDVAGAEKSLAKALELNPESKWAWLWKGVVAMDFKKDGEAARACYAKALEIDPKFDLAFYNLGWTYATGGKKRYDLARAEMKKALAVNPCYKEACYAIGMFYGYEDNYPVAKVWMEKAIAIDSNFLLAHKWRGIICGEMSQYEEATRSFDAAILLDPMNADLYVRRAKMLAALDKFEDALRDLNFAYELDPAAKRTLLYLGDVYRKADNAGKAMEFYEKAIAADEKYDDAYARKASLLAQMKKTGEAIASLDTAIKVSGYKTERFWMQKGDIFEAAGKIADAARCYKKARDLSPRLTEAWRKEALALKRIGKSAQANAAAESYLELVPSDAEFKKKIRD